MTLLPPEYFFPMLGMAFALGWGVLGTFRWFVKERLRAERTANEGRGSNDERFAELESRLAELEERLDFAERMLAQQREAGRLEQGRG
ncbi:MAG TPA: hypothetical protein VNL18_01385 [Gemmatimonadales bacterium]|nr:hypothetical protein [Gemmatimonadales bacterium]